MHEGYSSRSVCQYVTTLAAIYFIYMSKQYAIRLIVTILTNETYGFC